MRALHNARSESPILAHVDLALCRAIGLLLTLDVRERIQWHRIARMQAPSSEAARLKLRVITQIR